MSSLLIENSSFSNLEYSSKFTVSISYFKYFNEITFVSEIRLLITSEVY